MSFLLFLFAISINPVGWAAPTIYAHSETKPNGTVPDSEEAKEEKMHGEEHKHDEGMHGMFGHHSTGWGIAIGIVMVVMMAAMIL